MSVMKSESPMSAAEEYVQTHAGIGGLPDDPEAGTFTTCANAALLFLSLNDAPPRPAMVPGATPHSPVPV